MTRAASVASIGPIVLAAVTSCASGVDRGHLVASGHVEAVDVRILTKVRGILRERPVDEGDVVKPGQLVAVLDTVDTELLLRQAKAERDRAEADWRLAREGSRPEDIGELEARVASVTASLEGAEKELVRQEALLRDGITTASSRDDALSRRDTLRGDLGSARQALARARAGSRRQEIDAARALVDAAEARIAQYEQQIADARIVSPVAGIVTQKIAEPGELLAPGAAIVVVTDLAQPWLTVYVAEPDLGRIKLGAAAEVMTDGGERRQGKVTFIASRAEFTPKNVQTRDERVKLVYRVKVGIENDDGLFKPGMPAEARF
jgi:HlyD family secretion protein